MTDWIVERATIDDLAILARFLRPRAEAKVKQELEEALKDGYDIWAAYDPHGDRSYTLVGAAVGGAESGIYRIGNVTILPEKDVTSIAKRMACHQIQRARGTGQAETLRVYFRKNPTMEKCIAGYQDAGFQFGSSREFELATHFEVRGELVLSQYDAKTRAGIAEIAHR